MFEPEVFWKKMYCIEERTCDIVGTYQRPPHSLAARGVVPPLPPPRYALARKQYFNGNYD